MALIREEITPVGFGGFFGMAHKNCQMVSAVLEFISVKREKLSGNIYRDTLRVLAETNSKTAETVFVRRATQTRISLSDMQEQH
jgi:hypothetical protein